MADLMGQHQGAFLKLHELALVEESHYSSVFRFLTKISHVGLPKCFFEVEVCEKHVEAEV